MEKPKICDTCDSVTSGIHCPSTSLTPTGVQILLTEFICYLIMCVN